MLVAFLCNFTAVGARHCRKPLGFESIERALNKGDLYGLKEGVQINVHGKLSKTAE